ncbi:mannose-1-phosphate guanylyltransferase [Dyadobacter fanqingshengii]|uniref:mannose-1-phosphate guanylyltransferase n=1 Tax=Dyadobacter fanqingshengii TaxID=2906443 RepID=A0A9X1PEC9_9BACT|nr:sugar phosphate nucleotidyltransferase [Dyadobacter fanqingshengii]MCF0043554.1 NTP transferase domain-containing protein [Dyadobacter fanqingshengii]MCF2504099.1 NTP transferase domain-containing protein [Dyadobacter fanqingshengii]USJ34827.1 sugar phosphate nucleotidyltransferase [Dyadobacter fanqingshengii]
MQDSYVIIMAGGVGTRFWPFSRTDFPKQFHDVLGTGKTLLQQTVERFDGVCPIENIYIVTSQEYKDIVKEQIPALTDDQILLEPNRRNTAPCIAYACYKIAAKNPNANVVVAPADHIILKEENFRDTINIALGATRNEDILVTLGIQPSRPDTGYGYIQYIPDKLTVKKVKSFTEKPHLELAIKFLDSGDFVWNAGIFVWNINAFKKALKKFQPNIAEIFEGGENHYYLETEDGFVQRAYQHCGSISIDNGIMEKADNVHVVLSNFGWSDLGTWKSLYEVSEKDANLNVTDGNLILHNTTNSIIKTPMDKLVVVNGLDGFIVAEYDGVLLICKKEDEQKVKEFVAEAKELDVKYV